jgi:Arc/MetJ-type ribon-helix-helix transcriptional regulator
MSSEEVPFKSMKITLSEDVIDKLSELVKTGSFRSNSSAVEECIRIAYDMIVDMNVLLASQRGKSLTPIQIAEAQQEAFRRYLLRLARFIVNPQNLQNPQNSAGT